jgi:hypothetical protein
MGRPLVSGSGKKAPQGMSGPKGAEAPQGPESEPRFEQQLLVTFPALEAAITAELASVFSLSACAELAQFEAPLIASYVWNRLATGPAADPRQTG